MTAAAADIEASHAGAPDNEKRPQGESAGAECAAVGGVQVHGGAAAQALVGVLSERARSDAGEV